MTAAQEIGVTSPAVIGKMSAEQPFSDAAAVLLGDKTPAGSTGV